MEMAVINRDELSNSESSSRTPGVVWSLRAYRFAPKAEPITWSR